MYPGQLEETGNKKKHKLEEKEEEEEEEVYVCVQRKLQYIPSRN